MRASLPSVIFSNVGVGYAPDPARRPSRRVPSFAIVHVVFLSRSDYERMSDVAEQKMKTEVLNIAKRVIWWIGLILLLPAASGWFDYLPIAIFQTYPYPVSFSSHIWVDRMIMSTNIGILCWGLVGIINVIYSVKNTSLATQPARAITSRIFVAVITFVVALLAGAALLFLLVVVSNSPR